ncbi:TrmH family RNA methyltransferase [Patescibacteria group bacterium]
MKQLKPKDLRISDPTEKDLRKIKRNPIYFILDRIIDTYNVGSLFRLADAVAVKKMYLCGDMEFPPNSRIHKAAVGTEKWVPWKRETSTLKTVRKLKKKGVHVVAIEQSDKSVSWNTFKPEFPVAIVAGNESEGLPQEVLDEVDAIVELPMYGINNSFNVWGSAAVVAYKVIESL